MTFFFCNDDTVILKNNYNIYCSKNQTIFFIYETQTINGGGGKPDNSLEFIFNQTGQGDIITTRFDTGLLDYISNNIKGYQGKYQEDGSMLVTEFSFKDRGNRYQYALNRFKYSNEEITDDYFGTRNFDFFINFPTLYYRVRETDPDVYIMTFSIYPFDDCLKVFGEDILIGYAGAWYQDGKGYANYYGDPHVSFTLSEAKENIIKRGDGYYCLTSDELGVLVFLNVYANGLNSYAVLSSSNGFFGVSSLLNEGSGNRKTCPNIELDNLVAKVTHNDGVVEYLDVPYLWNQSFSKLHITKYLNIIPKSVDEGVYNVDKECWINEKGVGLYYHNKNVWGISGDKGVNDKMPFRCRPCFKGKIVETTNVEYFKSVPIIN